MLTRFSKLFGLMLVVGSAFAIGGCAWTRGHGLSDGVPDYVPTDEVLRKMTPEQARKSLQSVIQRGGDIPIGLQKSVALSLESVYGEVIEGVREEIKGVAFTGERIELTTKGRNNSTSTRSFWFAFLQQPKVYCGDHPGRVGACVVGLSLPWRLLLYRGTGSDTIRDSNRVADALYVLGEDARKAMAEDDARFAQSLGTFREMASRPALPEEVRKYKVQAEGAVRDKRFDDAAAIYEEVLKIAPWWTEGHFNRAVLLGETGGYEMAIREMKRYLLLVPNALNARAAQDNIYVWELKARNPN